MIGYQLNWEDAVSPCSSHSLSRVCSALHLDCNVLKNCLLSAFPDRFLQNAASCSQSKASFLQSVPPSDFIAVDLSAPLPEFIMDMERSGERMRVHSKFLYAQALVATDSVFAGRRSSPRQQHLRAGLEKSNPPQKELTLFHKTVHGALIGDLFMSLIHTCILEGIDPFGYLVALQKNYHDVFKNPQNWMPWNYPKTPPANAPP